MHAKREKTSEEKKSIFSTRLAAKEKEFLLKFFAIFFALFLLLKAIDATPPASEATNAVKLAVAAAEETLLQNTGFAISRQGTLLSNGAQGFEIIVECTGLVLVILLVALLYSTDVKPHRRKRALLLYAPALLGFNIVRLYATIWTGLTFGFPAMDLVHPALWIIDSLLVLFLWSRAAEIRL